jgi:hypothetical protein
MKRDGEPMLKKLIRCTCLATLIVIMWSQFGRASKPLVAIRDVFLESLPQVDVVHIRADGPVADYNAFELENPKRIVVDVLNCKSEKTIRPVPTNGTFIRNLRMGTYPDKVRVAGDLPQGFSFGHLVRLEGNELIIRVQKGMAKKGDKDRAVIPGKEASLHDAEAPLEADGEETGIGQEDSEFSSAQKKTADDVWKNEVGSGAKSNRSGSSLWADEGDTADESTDNKSAFQLTGMIRDKLTYDLKEDDDKEDDLSNHGKFRFGAKYVPHDRFHALFSMDVDYLQYKNDSNWDYDDTVRLYNAYVNWSSSAFNLKIGNQILRWGKTDGYSPLDNLNPEDYRDGIAGRREDRKLPIPMVNLQLYRGKFSIQGVYIPVFVEPELEIVGTDWAVFQHADEEIGGFSVRDEEPSHCLSNSEFGFRFAGILKKIDYAFSWFHTREDLPSIDTLSLPIGFPMLPGNVTMRDLLLLGRLTGQTVTLKHDRQNIYGVEFETTTGDFGLRGDLAYFDKSSYITREVRRTRKPTAHAMVGVDYNGPEAWYANLQFFQSFIVNYDDSISGADKTASAINGTLSKEFFNGNIKPECRAYYDLSGDATLLNPKVIINYWEPLIIEVGAELFDGSEETIIGMFGENDLVYAQFEANF